MTCFNLELKLVSVAESRCVESSEAPPESAEGAETFFRALRQWAIGPGQRRIHGEGKLSQWGELRLNGAKVESFAVTLIETPQNADSRIGVLVAVDPYEDHEAGTTEGPFCEVRVSISRAMFEALANRAAPSDEMRLFVDIGQLNGPLQYDHAPGDLKWTTTEDGGRMVPIESYSLAWGLPDEHRRNDVERTQEGDSDEPRKNLEAAASMILPALVNVFRDEMSTTRAAIQRLGYGLIFCLTTLTLFALLGID